MAQVVVRQLGKRYGEAVAAREISFEVNSGEIFGLLGPNGAGKTTTLECVIGLRRPDEGSIEICGIDALQHPGRAKQLIGAQLQSTSLQDKITPREALTLFSSFYSSHATVQSLLDRFSLGPKADAPFDSLSGGQRQRLGLALAFVNEPKVMFLDEPTTGLDPQSRHDLHQSIRQLREEGRSVLLTTHYLEEAEQLCDRIAIVDRGQIIASGSPRELVGRLALQPRLRFRAARPVEVASLASLPGITDARVVADDYHLQSRHITQSIIELVRFLEREGNELQELQVEKPSLEDAFLQLTGSGLRE